MQKNSNYFEIIVGTFVLLAAAFFFFSSFNSSKISRGSGTYQLIAKFENIDGLNAGSDVKISGVKIGSIDSQFLDEKDFRATLKISIEKNIKLPSDSSAKVSSEGLLGSKYLSISPGGSDENLQNGEEIQFTQSSVNFEDLLGKFIFSSEAKKDDKK